MNPLQDAEKRKFIRHPFNIPIRLEVAFNGSARSETKDISQTGLSFLWSKHLDTGHMIHITIPVRKKRFEVDGEIAYSEKDTKTGYFRTGVRFTDADSAFKARLAEETLEIMQYRRKLSKTLDREIPLEEAAKEWIKKYASHFNV